jgi:hypothetical protein
VELAYSKADERADFRHAIISYSGASGDAVLVTHGGATYALFLCARPRGRPRRRLGSQRRDGGGVSLLCGGSVDNLTTDFFETAAVPRTDGHFEVPSVFFDHARQHR